MENGEETSKPLAYKDYLEGTGQILDESIKERGYYKVLVLGKEFIVYPNVFSPKYFRDTELFAENLPVKTGEEMLEIGSGTGIISIVAVEKGAKKVLALDINPDAVRNTQENIERYNLKGKIKVRQSDVYDALKPDEKFDTIFWNVPLGFIEKKKISNLEKAVFDPGYESIEKLIKGARNYLKEKGRLLIGFSTTLGRLDLLKKFTDEAEFDLNVVYETESEEVYPVKFQIYEAKPKPIKINE